nr:DUF559 domain-containing protein [Arenimonas malthae]
MHQRDFAKHLRQSMTEAERRLWYHLRAHRFGGHKFRRQVPVGPYIVDFLHHGAGLVVEADGGQHNGPAGDGERDAWLQRHGYRVLRFWNHEILQNTQVVLEVIWNALGARLSPEPSPPAPLPQAGEGSKARL